jgi:hypothetical protein
MFESQMIKLHWLKGTESPFEELIVAQLVKKFAVFCGT